MDFEELSITLQEADRRYAGLKRQHEAGALSDEGFDEQLKQLMVLDDQNRWWAKSRRTGEWHYFDGNAWIKGTPPRDQEVSTQESEEPSIHKPSLDELLGICAKYDGPRFYVGDAIPNGTLADARSYFSIPSGESVAALVDNSPAAGLAICDEGIRWFSASAFFISSIRGVLNWPDFANVTIQADRLGRPWPNSYKLRLGESIEFVTQNQVMDSRQLVPLLREIQSLATASPAV